MTSRKKRALALLNRAADLAQSVHEDDRETSWCEDVEVYIRSAIDLLGGSDDE